MTNSLGEMIAGVVAVARQRDDTILRMHCNLGDLTFGNEHLSLGAILPETNGRFAQFKRLLDKTPCGPVATLTREIRYGGGTPIGLTWADLDESFVFSLGYCSPWSDPAIPCERHEMDERLNINIVKVSVCNVATILHAEHWQERVRDYGYSPASSSMVYHGNGFYMRMHFHDHDPAHVHIYPRHGDTRNRIARVRIDNCDTLDGSLSSAMDHEITEFITQNRQTLLDNWERIKTGRSPERIE